MFKSIEYKLYFFVALLIASVAASACFALTGSYFYMAACVAVALSALWRMRKSYHQFNKNILFLLNALDNGDYSFNFSENKLSRREKELNRMMNRIKDILSRARKEVVENEKFLGIIMESVSTGIIILNDDNMLLRINRTVNQLLGMPVFTHLNQLANIDKSFPGLFRNLSPTHSQTIKIANEREEKQIVLRASEIVMKQGRMKIIALNNIGSELDYKEMDSWIRLIRVMTHEIMNSIAPITSLTEMLLSAFRQSSPSNPGELAQNTVEALQTINTTAKGLENFVNSYRQFTGIPKPQLKPTSVFQIVEQAVSLQAACFEEKGIELCTKASASDEVRELDESQILQVLANLLKNAAEAIPEKGGRILVEMSRDKERLYVDVCNDGPPIPEEIQPQIFIPFFTTKDAGSGIGLSVSRYIMRLHGGNLTHFTRGEWTVFRMTM